MARRKSTVKPVSPAATAVPTIWRCTDPMDTRQIGFLVTEAGNINKPIFFAGRTWGADEEVAFFQAAQRIAADPSAIWRWGTYSEDDGFTHSAMLVDLRSCGRLDSTMPVPRFVYSLYCRPVNTAATEASIAGDKYPEVKAEEVVPIEPTPYCRFLAAELAEREKQSA